MNPIKKISRDRIDNHYRNVIYSLSSLFPNSIYLKKIASECNSVTEFVFNHVGNRITFTWCLLHSIVAKLNFNEKNEQECEFTSIFSNRSYRNMKYVKFISQNAGIRFSIRKDNGTIKKTDMLFVCVNFTSLNVEEKMDMHKMLIDFLKKNCHHVQKYIVLYYDPNEKGKIKFNDNKPTKYSELSAIRKFLQSVDDWSLLLDDNIKPSMIVLHRLDDVSNNT